VQHAFALVVFGAVALFVVVGVLSMLSRGRAYDQIGQGGLTMGEGQAGESWDYSEAAPTTTKAEREREIRQMLQARSERMVRQGHPPLDIEAEVARLEQPETRAQGSHDPSLTEEVRQLVVARNARRQRQGEAPLDVESEVERTLRELDP
jgi:hypothetical protein